MINKESKVIPWLWLVVGGGVAIAVVLVMVGFVGAGQLGTWSSWSYYNSSPSPTAAPVTNEQCECYCVSSYEDQENLCAVRWPEGELCEDRNYEFTDVNGDQECSRKEDQTCRGWTRGEPDSIRGTLTDCEIVAST